MYKSIISPYFRYELNSGIEYVPERLVSNWPTAGRRGRLLQELCRPFQAKRHDCSSVHHACQLKKERTILYDTESFMSICATAKIWVERAGVGERYPHLQQQPTALYVELEVNDVTQC